MTLTLPRRHLADAVAHASHGDHVRLELRDGKLIVAGADMMTMVVVELSTTASAPSSVVTLPTKLLSATLKACQQDDVEIDIAATRLRLRSGSYRGEVAAQGRLPGVTAVPDEMWQTLSSEQATKLGAALRCAAVAALSDPARPTVSGVRLELRAGSYSAVGTDGSRLHWVEVGDVGLRESLTLPSQCVGAVCDALAEAEVRVVKVAKLKKGAAAAPIAVPIQPPTLRIAVGANNVAVQLATPTSRRTVYCRRAPEPYSEWRRVAEDRTSAAAALTMQRDVLLAQLKACPADAVTLTPGVAQLQLDYIVLDDTSTRRLGEGGVAVAAAGVLATATQTFQVKVSTAYLRDAVAQCGDEVVLSMSPSQPVRVRSDSFSAVVMFVR